LGVCHRRQTYCKGRSQRQYENPKPTEISSVCIGTSLHAVFVVGIGLQAIVIFLLIKPPVAPENDLGGQLSVSDTSANLKNRGEDRKAA